MTPTALETLTSQIDEAFFFIGVAILLIELGEAWFSGKLSGRTWAEMAVSASTQIPYLFVQIVLLTGAYGVYYLIAAALPWSIPNAWWALLLVLVLSDITYYWEHRIAHEVRLLWTQHAVHHSSRDMNIVTGIRFGPLEGIWSMVIHLPLVLAGFSPEALFFGVIVVLAYQTWLHTELIGKLGPLEAVLNTPSHHRVHHGSDAKYLDKNYGGILIIWDRLWGTFQVEEETPRYGLVRDFDTRNLFRVWVSEIPSLWRDLCSARSWRQAWHVLFGAPVHEPNK